MKQFQVVVRKEIEGVEASIPSMRECKAWAKTEDDALAGLLERAAFFLNLPPKFKHILDRSRREGDETFYTLIVKEE